MLSKKKPKFKSQIVPPNKTVNMLIILFAISSILLIYHIESIEKGIYEYDNFATCYNFPKQTIVKKNIFLDI